MFLPITALVEQPDMRWGSIVRRNPLGEYITVEFKHQPMSVTFRPFEGR